MGRIKGVNSDYRYIDGAVREVRPDAVELRLFVCPDGMPSHVEPPLADDEDRRCNGTAESCPGPGGGKGHTLIHLDEREGVQLVAGRENRLVVDQAGSIRLEPGEGRAEVCGDFVVRTPGGPEIRLEVSADRVTLRRSGAEVSIDRTGDIDLRTVGGLGTVRVHGDLEVSGAVRSREDRAAPAFVNGRAEGVVSPLMPARSASASPESRA